MEKNKLSFSKRIFLCKRDTFEKLKEIDIEKADNTKVGFHSIKNIITALNPILEKYDLDLDVEIKQNEVISSWFDNQDEAKVRSNILDFSRVPEIGKLPLMKNEIMSYGALISYIRRYALTLVLNLNATEKIGNTNNLPKLTQNQIARLFAIANKKNLTEKDIKKVIKTEWNIESIKELNNKQYDLVCKRIENMKNKKDDDGLPVENPFKE